MLLKDLVGEVPDAALVGGGDVEVTGVSHDSRGVEPGFAFVAVPGAKVDGHDYLVQAIDGGAAVLVVEQGSEAKWRPLHEGSGVPCLVVPDSRMALAQVSATVYGYPARRLGVIGITGTDGKTSLAHLVAHILNSSGAPAGLISTAECRVGERVLGDTGRFTTPEAPEVQRMLAEMVREGCRWAVVEATSHGLALHRVDRCEYDIAVFTNLGRDHLDFHRSMEEYREAKGRLFQMLDEAADKGIEKTALGNADDPAWEYFSGLTGARKVSYGLDSPADLTAADIDTSGWSTRFRLRMPAGEVEAEVPRPGQFNVYNALAATGACLAAGMRLEEIVRGLRTWPGAPGRMELVDEGQPFRVVVDFAHAPDSLARVLALLRETSAGRIIAVFGCIGERDRERRPGMGRAAARDADYTIVTDDNPYSEDRDAVIREIVEGLEAEGKREWHDFSVVPDRREAIAQALAMAVDEDVVLLAGKGHEREVNLGETAYECHDPSVAREVLGEMGYRKRGRNSKLETRNPAPPAP